MASTNIGSALLRIIGAADLQTGEYNPASMSDAFDVIDAIMGSAELRSHCAALANLSSDVPLEKRKQTCRALLIIMTSKRVPLVDPPMVGDKPDYEQFRNTTQEYAALAAPRPNSKWEAHTEARYKKSSVPEFVRVSPHLAELISTFEALFGIHGALLVR